MLSNNVDVSDTPSKERKVIEIESNFSFLVFLI